MSDEGTPFPVRRYGTGNAMFDLNIQSDQARMRQIGPRMKPFMNKSPQEESKRVRCELSGVAKFPGLPKKGKCPGCGTIARVRRPSGIIAWHSYKQTNSPSEQSSGSTTGQSTSESPESASN